MTKNNIFKTLTFSVLFILYSCSQTEVTTITTTTIKTEDNMNSDKINIDYSNLKSAYFASGCFWGTEYWFEKADGVADVVSGYAGGDIENPTYQDVSTGRTGHLEAVRVDYDPSIISYEDLVKLFFETHDYSQENGQGPDIGPQYLSAIFYNDESEKETANKYVDILQSRGEKVATMLKPFTNFYDAEDYHQDYYTRKNSTPYCHVYKKIF